jgi:hypothetical protein
VIGVWRSPDVAESIVVSCFASSAQFPGETMSHGNEKTVLGLMSIAFQNSKSLQEALAHEGNDPASVSEFMIRHYQAMQKELGNPEPPKRK